MDGEAAAIIQTKQQIANVWWMTDVLNIVTKKVYNLVFGKSIPDYQCIKTL